MRDELGDLLLQVVFHAQMAKEQGLFGFDDVVESIAAKMLRRHPHVFDRDGSSLHRAELDKQWDEIKRSEVTHNKSCLADHLPHHLPALQRAQKLISKTCRLGRQTELPIFGAEILQDTSESLASTTSDRLDEKQLGQALFDLVSVGAVGVAF